MGHVIINFPDDFPADEAVRVVSAVMDLGRISKGTHGPQYCWATTIEDLNIYATKTELGSDSFTVQRRTDAFPT